MNNGNFAIGKVIKVTAAKGGQMVDYTYNFANRRMYNTKKVNLGLNSVGMRFLVKVLPNSPQESRLLLEYPLPDTFAMSQPDSGWLENPLMLHEDYR